MMMIRNIIKVPNAKPVKGFKIAIYVTMILAFLCGLLETLGAPHAITYLFDVLTIILFFQIVLTAKSRSILIYNPVFILQIILFLYGTLIALLQGVSPILTLWSIRNNIKFIIFFGACVSFLNEKDIDRIYSLFAGFELLNLLLALYQKFVLNTDGDNLGGIFGTDTGCNGILNCYLVIMFIHHFVRWMQKEEKIFPLVLSTTIGLTIAVLSELKFYFIEIAIIFVIYTVWISIVEHRLMKLFKLSLIVVMVILGIGFAIQNLVKIYPHWGDFFSIENIIYQSTKSEGYTGHGDINRLSGISTINTKVFSNNYLLQIFGMGLGSTEFVEGKAILTSEFFLNHMNLHYHYFSLPWMYLETGTIGLCLYLGSFISILFICFRRRQDKFDISVTTSVFLLGCMVMLFLIYNQSMRTTAAYIVYAYISTLFIQGSTMKRIKELIRSVIE